MTAAHSVITRESSVSLPALPDFEAVYASNFEFVWRCLRLLGVAPTSLDDAAQEVFMVVHRRFADIRGCSSVRCWLHGVVRNVANNQRRSQRRRRTEPLPQSLELPSSAPGPHEQLTKREFLNFVQAFLAGLDESKRHLFVLALLEEISIPEVAEMLEIPLNTAYSRVRGVRLEFQRALRRSRVAP